MEIFSLPYALLSVQKALLGIITPELRAVIIDIKMDERILYIRFYHQGAISEELLDLWQCAMAEIDVGLDCFFDEGIEQLDHPNPIPLRGKFAYLRKEPTSFQRPAFVMEECSFAYVMLATQNALLAVVTPALRSVIVDLDNAKHVLYIRFYYHGAVSEELIDLWNRAITEVISSMNFAYVLDQGIERIDYPNEMPFRGRYAYLRKE